MLVPDRREANDPIHSANLGMCRNSCLLSQMLGPCSVGSAPSDITYPCFHFPIVTRAWPHSSVQHNHLPRCKWIRQKKAMGQAECPRPWLALLGKQCFGKSPILPLFNRVAGQVEVLLGRSVIGIWGLESESVKNNSDSFRFRFLPKYTGGRVIAFRFKTVSDASLFYIPIL